MMMMMMFFDLLQAFEDENLPERPLMKAILMYLDKVRVPVCVTFLISINSIHPV
jgi:hypothetical protein